ncbi:hypothetical protein GJ496_002205 [Pomphorhynchus laevis]|nr:hypothetical protein GJ496_002205 [Pomphorhynchus laevis]
MAPIKKHKGLGRPRKLQNRYKFQTLAERLSTINLSKIYRRQYSADDNSTTLSKFNEELERLSQLDLTRDYAMYYKQHKFKYVNIQQIVHHKAEIVKSLIESIDHCTCASSISSFCQLWSALAADLQREFYLFYPVVFKCLRRTLFKFDEDKCVIEPVFQSLSFIFNATWRVLCFNFKKIFRLFKTLSTSRKQYIKQFAGECICFLLRKVKDISLAIRIVFQTYDTFTEKDIDFLCIMFTECTKSVQGNLHKCTIKLLKSLVEAVNADTEHIFFKILGFIFNELGNFCQNHMDVYSLLSLLDELCKTDFEHAGVKCLIVYSAAVFCENEVLNSRWISADIKRRPLPISLLIPKLYMNIYRIAVDLIPASLDEQLKLQCSVHVFKYLFNFSQYINTWSKDLFTTEDDRVFITIMRTLCAVPNFETKFDWENACILLCEKRVKSLTTIIAETFLSRATCFDREYNITYGFGIKVVALLNESLKSSDYDTAMNCLLVSLKSLVTEAHFDNEIIQKLSTYAVDDDKNAFMLAHLLELSDITNLDHLAERLFHSCCFSTSTYKLCLCYQLLVRRKVPPLSEEIIVSIIKSYAVGLKSYNQHHRRLLLDILKCVINTANEELSERFQAVNVVVDKILDVENIPMDFENFREKNRLVAKLNAESLLNQFKDSPLIEILTSMIVSYLVGLLTTNFTVIWNPTIKIFQSFAEHTPDAFVSILVDVMQIEFNILNSDVTTIREENTGLGSLNKSLSLFINLKSINCDHYLFYSNLWSCFDCSIGAKLIERKNKIFVSMFLDCIAFYNQLLTFRNNCVEAKSRIKQTRRFLITVAKVISKSQNIRSFAFKDKLKQSLLQLIQSSDAELSVCSFAVYKGFCLIPSSICERLTKLYDPKMFRTEILFIRSELEKMPDTSEKEEFSNVLLRILCGRLLQKDPNSRNHKCAQSKKRAIIQIIFAMGEQQQSKFLLLALSPFNNLLTNHNKSTTNIADIDDYGFLQFIKKAIESKFENVELRIDHINGALTTIEIAFGQLNCCLPSTRSMVFRSLSISVAISQYASRDSESNNLLSKLFQTSMYLFIKLINKNRFNLLNQLEVETINMVLRNQTKLVLTNGLNPLTINQKIFELLYSLSKCSRHRFVFASSLPEFGLCCDCVILPLINVRTDHIFLKNCKIAPMFTYCINALINLFQEDATTDDNKVLSTAWIFEHVDISLLQRMCTHLNLILIEFIERIGSRRKMANLHDHITSIINILEWSQSKVSMGDFNFDDLCLRFVNVIKSCRKLPEVFQARILAMQINHVTKITNHELILSKMSGFLSSFKIAQSRKQLIDIFVAIGATNVKLRDIVDILIEINSFNPERINEIDISRRLNAIRSVNDILKVDCTNTLLIELLIHNFGYFVRQIEEFSLRTSVLNSIYTLIDAIDKQEVDVKQLLFQQLLTEIKLCFRCKSEDSQQDATKILRALVLKRVEVYHVSSLHVLSSEDEEVDFFLNIHHTQNHRRSRALVKLVNSLRVTNFSNPLKNNILRPMLEYFVKVAPRKDTCKDVSRCLQTINEKAVEALGIIIAKQQISKLKLDISRCVSNIDKPKNDEAICDFNIRLLLSIVRELPFDLQDKTNEFLSDSVIPILFRILFEKKPFSEFYEEENRHVLRASSSTILIGLLMRMPDKSFQFHFSSIILKLLDYLKSRSITSRSKARQCLVKIIQMLNEPWQWCYIFNELCRHLQKGFEKHVLIYTINALLEAVNLKLSTGDLSKCMNSITKVMNEELFERLGDEKKIFKATIPEAKSTRSFEGYTIIAKFVYKDDVMPLFTSFYEVLKRNVNSKTVHNVQHCMHNVSCGLLLNDAIKVTDLISIAYNIALQVNILEKYSEDNSCKNHTQRLLIKRPESCCIIPTEPARNMYRDNPTMNYSSYVFLTCSFQLLSKALKKLRSESSKEEFKNMVNDFVNILVKTIDVKYIRVSASALCCLDIIFTIYGSSLPSIESNLPEITKRLSTLFTSLIGYSSIMPQANPEIIRMCFIVMARLIGEIEKFREHAVLEQNAIASFIENQLAHSDQQLNCFVLLRAMLKARLKPSGLKQIMDNMYTLSFNAVSHQELDQSRRIILMYLRNYQIKMSEIERILFTYTTHLDFPKQIARKMVTRMLKEIIDLVPQSVLDTLFHALLITVLPSVFNEPIREIYDEKRELLKKIITMISEDIRNKQLLKLTEFLEDLDGSMPKIRASCMTAVNVIIEIDESRYIPLVFSRIVDACENEMNCIEQCSLGVPNVSSVDNDDDNRNTSIAHHKYQQFLQNENETTILQQKHRILSLIVCMIRFEGISKIMTSQQCTLIWGWSLKCLQSSNVVCRIDGCDIIYQLLNIQFSIGFVTFDDVHKDTKSLINSLCQILRTSTSPYLSDRVAAILFLIVKLLSTTDCSIIRWIFGRVRRQVDIEATQNISSVITRNCAIKWIAAVAIKLDSDVLWPYLRIVLPILLRENDMSRNSRYDPKDKAVADLRKLSSETLDAIKKYNDHRLNEFLDVYNEVRELRVERKSKRKQNLATMAVKDPTRMAQRKLKKHHLKQKVKRQRKLK